MQWLRTQKTRLPMRYSGDGIPGTSMRSTHLISSENFLPLVVLLAVVVNVMILGFAFPATAAAKSDNSSTQDSRETGQLMREYRREHSNDRRKAGSDRSTKRIAPRPKIEDEKIR